MKETLEKELRSTLKKLFDVDTNVELTRPNNQFGDYATSVAMQLSERLGSTPQKIADLVKDSFKNPLVSEVKVSNPGFINLVLTDQAVLTESAGATKLPELNKAQQILVEFGDPNLFKAIHLGHLYSSIVGDSISKILEASGANVKRLGYHSDIGLNVAKCVWAVGQAIDWQLDKLDDLLASQSGDTLGHYYAVGNAAFESDAGVAEDIKQINKYIYERDREQVNQIYRVGRKLSIAYQDRVFANLGVHYDKHYFESEVAEVGTKLVQKNTPKVFEESDKALIYRGEKVGLHTRVFINSLGLPTYEAKDLGLAEAKNHDYPKSVRSIVVTANEQTEYFKVMLAALSEISPELAAKTTHLSHGFLSLTSGKMSSRSGQVYTAEQLIDEVKQLVDKRFDTSPAKDSIYLAAIKYSLLKQRLGSDMSFNLEESISLNGNSGPYIQYAHARAATILKKAQAEPETPLTAQLQLEEKGLAFKISEYPEVVEKAIQDYLPSHICKYMFELAQLFNSFYEHNRVLDHPRSGIRTKLVGDYVQVLQAGLGLLNISAPDNM